MKPNTSKSNKRGVEQPKVDVQHGTTEAQSDVPPEEAFYQEAKREPKRKAILDHTATIRLLREEKKFTFREIAEWFQQRGFNVDRSAIYRAWLLSIPSSQRDPEDTEWQEL